MIQETFFNECSHPSTMVIPETHGPHYAREVCSDCRKFLGWVEKPETARRRKANEEILTALSKLESLTGWEREFVRDVTRHKHVSPKQQDTILLLRDKYFAGGLP